MKTTLKKLRAMMIFLGIPLLWQQVLPQCQAQVSPYVPPASSVTITLQTNGADVSITVNVDLPDPCHYVGDWGQTQLVGQNVSVDAQFWDKTNVVCAQVITPVSTNYDLGTLPPGDYTVVFQVWGRTVKTLAFSVFGSPSPPNLNILKLDASTAQLIWPTNAADYILECSTTLSDGAWTTVTNARTVTGDSFTLNVDLSVPQMFYRLHKP